MDNANSNFSEEQALGGIPIEKMKFINLATYEVVDGASIYDAIEEERKGKPHGKQKFDWIKVHVFFMKKFLGVVHSSSFTLLLYIISIMNLYTNAFSYCRADFVRNTKISPVTVSKVMTSFNKHDIIRHKEGSNWMVNPNLLHTGDRQHQAILVGEYYQLKPGKGEDQNDNVQ